MQTALVFRFRMVWGSNQNYYTVGPTPYPEDHTTRENEHPILDMRCNQPCWHCGGGYLSMSLLLWYSTQEMDACMSVDRQQVSETNHAGTWLMGAFQSQGCLVGFVHGEDHYKVRPRGVCNEMLLIIC